MKCMQESNKAHQGPLKNPSVGYSSRFLFKLGSSFQIFRFTIMTTKKYVLMKAKKLAETLKNKSYEEV